MGRLYTFLESPRGLAAIIGTVMILWLACGGIMNSGWIIDPPKDAGTFGDMYGTINALFGGLTVAGVFYSILLTRRQLSDTQTELANQETAFKLQRFEDTFFKMLTMLNEITTNMDGYVLHFGEAEQQHYRGRNYIKHALENFQEVHMSNFSYEFDIENQYFIEKNNTTVINPNGDNKPTGKKLSVQDLKEYLSTEFDTFYKEHNSSLGHYFRYVYNIIKFIRRNVEDKAEIARYVELLQAQLSNDELGLLFYNAISDHGKNKQGEDLFRQWLDEYSVLENLTKSNLLEESHINFYPKTKFKFKFQGKA